MLIGTTRTLPCPLPCPAASNTMMLIASSMGSQAPFRAHLAAQTVNFLILATRGTCFCDSQVGGACCWCGSQVGAASGLCLPCQLASCIVA